MLDENPSILRLTYLRPILLYNPKYEESHKSLQKVITMIIWSVDKKGKGIQAHSI